ncbi:MAG: glycosyltransferase [Chitinophagaceae bacterium]
MKVVLVGTAFPYRGGLASFNEALIRKLQARDIDCVIKTFSLQYPNFLFPGKTQFSDSPTPQDLQIQRVVNAIDPLNWIKVGKQIARGEPDILLLKYWTPFMAPCLATISYFAKKNKHTQVITILDNMIPHEQHFFDRWLTSYFVHNVDKFIYMSKKVGEQLQQFTTSKPVLFSPHPVFENFGDKASKQEAGKFLQLDDKKKYVLFFGFVRDYKGLDWLLQAWYKVEKKSDKKLIIAGEYYSNKEKYLSIIQKYNLQGSIVLIDKFINNEDVKYYFSIADVVVQPYKHATQSGVTQIAYHFEKPMIVTNVGGLSEIVPDGKVGFVVEPNVEDIRQGIEKFFQSNIDFLPFIQEEKKKYSWDCMVDNILKLSNMK